MALIERQFRFFAVVEVLQLISDDLVGLVPLAGDDDDVVVGGAGDGLRDRGAAIGNLVVLVVAADAWTISAMIASGGSLRGLSLVTITSSARRAAISPISGRLPRS